MRALVQRVSEASVTVEGDRVAAIGPGLVVLLGITHDDDAARPEHAEPLYERVAGALNAQRGRFGAHMEVALVNDGPVTVLVELSPPRS